MPPDPDDVKSVAFRGRLSEDDYVRAQALAARTLSQGGTPLYKGCFGAGVVLLVLALMASGDGAYSWFLLSVVAFAAAWVLRDRTRELYRKDPGLQAYQSGWINDGGLLLMRQNVESRIGWGTYTGYAQEGDLLLLFEGPYRYLPFSRSLFAEGPDWEDLLALVDSHLYRVSRHPEPKSILSSRPFWITILILFLLSAAFAIWNSLWNL